MKRSFFIALAIYIALASGIYTFYEAFPIPRKIPKAINISLVKIKKPLCNCKMPSCKMRAANTPKQLKKKEVLKPKPKPKSKPKPKLKPKPKPKVKPKPKRKSKPKRKIVKKRFIKKVKKRVKKYKRVTPKKGAKKPSTPSLPKKVVSKKQTLPSHSLITPQKRPIASPKPSYMQRYLQTYHSLLVELIEKYKFYPRIARKTKKEGLVKIAFTLTPKGVESMKIVQSSGHKILDRAAYKTVRRALKELPKPKQKIDILVPIEYRLK